MESSNNKITIYTLKTNISQILPDYITEDILLKPCLCVKIENKQTSQFLAKLKSNNLILNNIYLKGIHYSPKNISKDFQKPSKFHIEQFEKYDVSFLKRVKKYNSIQNLILISFIEDLFYKNITKQRLINDYSLDENDFVELNIPCSEPISDEQYQKSNKIWPHCNFISSKEKYIFNHNETELKEMIDIYNNNLIINNTNNISSILYDPKNKKIVGKSKINPKSIIGHSIMNLLDNYSEYLIENNNQNKHCNKEDAKLLGKKNNIGPKENTNLLFSGGDKQYYCEGLYIFTVEEPCMMCAMACVHNRIARLYFGEKNEKEGALISKYSLDNYKLNHHYLIFKLS